ncbi:MAG TPA: FtsW/RodA/SpoVE family cell cycle protein [Thermoanaerobaculaceae bacterium]|nr:FtsW/RodA/SpoVE family cell cycle protein [Thermoanaerobaculaceae bacterium]
MPKTRQIDRTLLAVTVGTAAVGVVMVGSASGPLAREYYHVSEYEFAVRQLVAVVIGIGGMLAATFVPLERVTRWKVAFALLLATWVALLAAYFQRPINGTHRWLQLPVSSIQPSAVAKVILPLALAALLGRVYPDRAERTAAQRKALAVTAITVGLVLIEPDMGSALLLLAAAACILLIADVPLRPLAAMAGAAVLVFAVFAVIRPYRVERLRTFFGETSYQVQQSLIAIGGGGLVGRGLGSSLQKLFYLPQPHTDFIFAVIGEELGLVGTLGTLALLGVIVGRALGAAGRASSAPAALLASGLAVTIGVQALLNVSVCVKLLPAKGLPLPLLSAGGSDVMLTLTAIGLLLNIGKEGA